MKELGPAREDIMAEVERVSSAPIDRFDKNLRDQQSTKHAAFELLKMYGHDGHILSQPQQEREAEDRKYVHPLELILALLKSCCKFYHLCCK